MDETFFFRILFILLIRYYLSHTRILSILLSIITKNKKHLYNYVAIARAILHRGASSRRVPHLASRGEIQFNNSLLQQYVFVFRELITSSHIYAPSPFLSGPRNAKDRVRPRRENTPERVMDAKQLRVAAFNARRSVLIEGSP